jgi:N-acetylmuramoyl-L-alanine amidase
MYSALTVAAALALSAPAVAAPPAASPRVEKLRAAERALAKDTRRLRVRQHLDELVGQWRALAAASEGAERAAALEGEARAWALLAHWSGTARDRAEAGRARSRAAEALAGDAGRGARAKDEPAALAKDSARAPAPKARVASTSPAKATAGPKAAPESPRTPASMARLELVTSELGVEVVLPAHAALSARQELLPAKRGQGPRVYFDVSPVVAAPGALVTMAIDHPAVARLRVGQFDADTVRLVFDLPRAVPAPEVMAFVGGDSPRIRLGKRGVGEQPAAAGDPLAALLEIQRAIDGVAPGESAAITPEAKRALEQMVAEIRDADGPPPAPRAATAADAPDEDEITLPSDLASVPDVLPATPSLGPAAREARTPAPRRDSLVRIRRVIVDAGHGGKDGGASGKRGTKEKDVNLAIAKALAKVLEERLGVDVVLTRDKDVYLSLGKRVELAHRADADLFISVHSNAHRNRKYHGIETYYLNTTSSRYANRLAARENQEQWDDAHLDAGDPSEGAAEDDAAALPGGAFGRDLKLLLADLAMRSATDDSRRLAGFVQSSLVSSARRVSPDVADLGVKHALFFVLLGARMPSILIESGFLSHPDEEKRLADPAYQRRLAEAIATGVARFVEERNQVASRL